MRQSSSWTGWERMTCWSMLTLRYRLRFSMAFNCSVNRHDQFFVGKSSRGRLLSAFDATIFSRAWRRTATLVHEKSPCDNYHRIYLVSVRADVAGSAGGGTHVRSPDHRRAQTRQRDRQQTAGESTEHLVQQARRLGIHGSNGCKVNANANVNLTTCMPRPSELTWDRVRSCFDSINFYIYIHIFIFIYLYIFIYMLDCELLVRVRAAIRRVKDLLWHFFYYCHIGRSSVPRIERTLQ